ncbi:flagellar basal body protein [Acetobacter sp. AN02]|uniref:flagellar basal body rod protein FlgB n=1 Tax=Acetobacter sp. AN02 TaxID=2894186 RepID=UPI00243424A0|nr:flagellar basal body protein [Acetobacter sp. AN02]MDG6095612.1 flagellar basal body protein [Acetobacter sp. AN02]
MHEVSGQASAGGTDILGLAQKRMNWLQSRQNVLAANIANADTPGYTPKTVTPFGDALSVARVALEQTSGEHLPGRATSSSASEDRTADRSLNGNRVSLESQLEQVADTSDQQKFATNIYGTYRTLFSTVLGK